MKHLIYLLALIATASLPGQAGSVSVSGSVTVSAHTGGAGTHGSYGSPHATSGGAQGCTSVSYGPYSRCIYPYSYPYVSYGYGPTYVAAYQGVYAPPIYSSEGADGSVYVPAPPPSATYAPAPPTAVAPQSSGSVPMGYLDTNGYVHSPYTASIFKVPNVTNGQAVHDPATGQLFRVRIGGTKASTSTTEVD